MKKTKRSNMHVVELDAAGEHDVDLVAVRKGKGYTTLAARARIPDDIKRRVNAEFLAYKFDPLSVSTDLILKDSGDTVDDMVNACINTIYASVLDYADRTGARLDDGVKEELRKSLRDSCAKKYGRELEHVAKRVGYVSASAKANAEAPVPVKVEVVNVDAPAGAEGRVIAVDQPDEFVPGTHPSVAGLVAAGPRSVTSPTGEIIELPSDEEIRVMDMRALRKIMRKHGLVAMRDPMSTADKNEMRRLAWIIERWLELHHTV